LKLNLENTTCRNCGNSLPEQSLYCPKCSQKNTDGRIPIFAFVKDIFQNLFNLDSKFFKTSLGLFSPGKLTNEFFKGKHKSFATPSRLFLVTMILFFAMTNLVLQKNLKSADIPGGVFNRDSKKVDSKDEQIAVINELRKKAKQNNNDQFLVTLDSMEAEVMRLKIDTSYSSMNFFNRTYRFRTKDLQTLSADSLIQKYKIEKAIDKMMFKQGLKITNNPKELITYVFGNLTWMMLVLIPSVALFFKLFYWRRKKFYVEHLVFLFHIHSFSAILGILFFGGVYFFEWSTSGTYTRIFIIGSLIYFFISLKKVYKQSWGKTLLKFFAIMFSYFVIVIICITLLFLISFLLF